MKLICEGRVEGRVNRGVLSNPRTAVSEVIPDIFVELPTRDSGD
jgi:hypothetical protein